MEQSTANDSRQEFHSLVAQVAQSIQGRPLNAALQDWLNTHYGAHTPHYAALAKACASGLDQGWLCQRENGGIRWGRVYEASDALSGFSVDVVLMKDVAGPHHMHPLGEVDLIMPTSPGALFDGHPAGWCVYGPESAHSPTVTQGQAFVLYLLPEGNIQFTRRAA